MSEFAVDKAGTVSPPVKRAYSVRVSRYPWRELEVGDSFLVPNGRRNTIAPQAVKMAKKLGITLSVRKEIAGDGYRVWRLA